MTHFKKQLILGEWQPLDEATAALKERFMTVAPDFVLNRFDCKYINARIDMRTGAIILQPGDLQQGK